MKYALVILSFLMVVITSCEQSKSNSPDEEKATGIEQQIDPFQLYDLHVHLKGDLSIAEAVKKSQKDNVKYGIAVNCGLGFPIEQDSDVDGFVNQMQKYPQFYLAMQAEGREWVDMFSEEAMSKFDYVFTDAMTFTDREGRRNRIWVPSETWVDDEQVFMDDLVVTIVSIMNDEPIDIYVNATYLPEQINNRYDELWTEDRMDKVIQAAKDNDIAIEISNRFKIPSAAFIKRGKSAGVKFTSGTNNIDKNFPRPEYTLEMIKVCGLTEADFWLPERTL
jgi:hypothetical protein